MFIIFDIGGTKTRVGASFDGETINQTTVFETPSSYEAGMASIKKAAETLANGEMIQAIGGGIAGPFSQKKSSLVASPNLQAWVGKAFRSELESSFNAPVYVENDAALAGLGEAVRGAGRGFDIVAYMTVSTGVGGARIVSGKIDEKSFGFEPGHQIIDADKTMMPDADGVFLESYISGHSLTRRTGKKPKEITEKAFWDGYAATLAYGLNNICVFWSPDVIVLGGSMILGDPAIPIDKTTADLKKILKIYPELPEIKKAELGDSNGLYGALEYIKQQLAARPPQEDDEIAL